MDLPHKKLYLVDEFIKKRDNTAGGLNTFSGDFEIDFNELNHSIIDNADQLRQQIKELSANTVEAMTTNNDGTVKLKKLMEGYEDLGNSKFKIIECCTHCLRQIKLLLENQIINAGAWRKIFISKTYGIYLSEGAKHTINYPIGGNRKALIWKFKDNNEAISGTTLASSVFRDDGNYPAVSAAITKINKIFKKKFQQPHDLILPLGNRGGYRLNRENYNVIFKDD